MTTITVYAILGNQEDAEDIAYAQIHHDEAWAHTVARRLTKRQAEPMTGSDVMLDAPFRCVELRIEVIDPRDSESEKTP